MPPKGLERLSEPLSGLSGGSGGSEPPPLSPWRDSPSTYGVSVVSGPPDLTLTP